MKKLLIFLLLILTYVSVQSQTAEVSSRLKNKLASMSPVEYTPVLVLLRDRVNVEMLDAQLYNQKANIQFRAKVVIDALVDKAKSTQGPILNYLGNKQQTGKVTRIESFWITNMVLVEANAETIEELSRRPDVEQIDLDAFLEYDRPVGDPIKTADNIEASEIGLKVIKANKLWEVGITGAGRIVMNIDTGVDVTHPALNSRWRGNNGQPWWRAWFDKYGSTTQPTDCDVHGTHTMGIMCGRSSAGDTVGVAPNAQWIAARTICSSPHTSNSIAAFQWAMNPDSNSGTTSDMPDAIGNSWYDPDVTNECSGIYKTTLDALEAAGIAVVFSCGNSGPSSSSITKPKNINTNPVNCFSVGNLNGNQPFPYPITSSSSRGPSLCGGAGSLLIKPEVSAPGTSVRSSVPGGGYSLLTGTSMACPHVVGAVALLRQAAPNLTGKQILEALYNTAIQLPVGGVENNDYGKGVIDVWAAFQSLGPIVNHIPLNNTENLAGPYPVSATISSALSGMKTAKLFWSRNNPTVFDSINMTKGTGDNWSASIPGNGTSATYRYYIIGTDSLNKVGKHPGNAPATVNMFIASSDTTKPVITHTPLIDQPKVTWPASLSATVTDNIGVDSVWVKWYKNNTATGIKQFRLNFVSGSNYTGTFNSLNGDVIVGDSIFYRVFARDNSSMHNIDSTALYKFKIINLTTITIGSGTTSSNYPFTTYWKDGRTQYLYLASDLALMGTSALITKIGFDVISVGGPAMTDFKVSYKNTSLTTLSGFESGGFTVAYNPTSYTPSAVGWNMITMTTPMNYTGGNLIIDICYNNTTYTAYSTVNSTPAPGMFWGKYNDLTEPNGGCDYTAWTSSTNPPGRANTRFEFTTPLGTSNLTTGVPNEYNLSQNYPNPFNPVTKINFALPKQGLVTLKIYDVLGREVKTLVNEVKQAGSFSVDFNASEFASGVYFYKLESGTFSEVKRMMLIK